MIEQILKLILFKVYIQLRSFLGSVLNCVSFFDNLTANKKDLLTNGSSKFEVSGKSIAVYVVFREMVGDKFEELMLTTLKKNNFEIKF